MFLVSRIENYDIYMYVSFLKTIQILQQLWTDKDNEFYNHTVNVSLSTSEQGHAV